MTAPVTARLKLDTKRRPTLPASVLDAAGVTAGQDLIARVEGPGHIVLESPAIVLARLQAAVAAARPHDPTNGHNVDLVQELFEERAADAAAEQERDGDREQTWLTSMTAPPASAEQAVAPTAQAAAPTARPVTAPVEGDNARQDEPMQTPSSMPAVPSRSGSADPLT